MKNLNLFLCVLNILLVVLNLYRGAYWVVPFNLGAAIFCGFVYAFERTR